MPADRGVAGTPITGDQGGDVLFSFGGRKFVVQCKRYRETVGNKAVQEAHAAKGFYQCEHAWVVASSDFTPSAHKLASALGVTRRYGLLGLPNLRALMDRALRG